MSLLTKAGITKLSELTIDANKDWQAKEITNLKAIVASMVAGDLPYRGATVVERLPKSTPGYYLKQGADYPGWDVGPSAPEAAYESIELIPDDGILPTANPPGASKIDGANFTYDTLDFDQTTEESCFWEFVVSLYYMGQKITVDIFWLSTGAGDCKLGISTLGRKSGETFDSALGTEQTGVTTAGGAGILNRTRLEFYPGWASGDKVVVKLARKAADGADTLNADARIVGVAVHFTGEFTAGESFAIDPSMPVNVTPSTSGAWVTVDCKPYVPAGATGVILHIRNNDGVNYAVGFRKPGSTDDHKQAMYQVCHFSAFVGVNSQREFEAYLENVAQQILYLEAYTKSGVTFFTNAIDKTPAGSGWLTVNCSVQAPGATGLIFDFEKGNSGSLGYRKNGSADFRITGPLGSHSWFMVGCDAGQLIQVYRTPADATDKYWLIGYITGGCVFKLNANDISLGATDVYTEIDLSAIAPESIMAMIEVYDGSGANRHYDLRKKGYSGENYRGTNGHCMYLVPVDETQKIEGKINSIQADFFVMGYAVLA